jgi:hypothetical protein
MIHRAWAYLAKTDPQMATIRYGMTILTVRLTADEERLLTKRSKDAGVKKAAFVKQLIREEPFVTGADVVKDAERRMGATRIGDARLRISRVRVARIGVSRSHSRN